MKIIIIGAGLAGIVSYLHLRKHLPPDTEITILERHASEAQNAAPSTFAGALGVGPNGMRVLRQLDPTLHARVQAAGAEVRQFELRTAGGWSLGLWPAGSGDVVKQGTVMIVRRQLWEILKEELGAEVVKEGVKVMEVRQEGEVILEGGERIKADLIIGADGFRSISRAAVIDEGEKGRDVEFQSLMNIGGFFPLSYMEFEKARAPVRMTFGSGGFVGLTPVSTSSAPSIKTAVWWSTYTDDPSEEMRKTTNNPSDPALPALMEDRHRNWVDPTIQRILADVTGTSSQLGAERATLDLHTPTWILPKLPRWSRGRIVLVGDAAHTLPSSSGQGVSQAFEDAAALALLLCAALSKSSNIDESLDENVVKTVCSAYEQLRKPRVERMLDEALRMQSHKKKLGWWEETLMFAILWILVRVGGGSQERWRYDYDIEEEVKRHVNEVWV